MKDPEKRREFTNELLKNSLTRKVQFLTRDQLFEFFKLNEENQLAYKIKMVDTDPSGQSLPPAIQETTMMIEKIKSDDRIFLAIGIDHRDVMPSMAKLGLTNDPEFIAMRDEIQKKLQVHCEMRKAERDAQEKEKTEKAVEQKVEKKGEI